MKFLHLKDNKSVHVILVALYALPMTIVQFTLNYTNKKGEALSIDDLNLQKIGEFKKEGYSYVVFGKVYEMINHPNYNDLKKKLHFVGGNENVRKVIEVYEI